MSFQRNDGVFSDKGNSFLMSRSNVPMPEKMGGGHALPLPGQATR